MRIQPIAAKEYYYKSKPVNYKKTNLQTDSVAFKANYEQLMQEVLVKDLKNRVDVGRAMSELYLALVKENGIKKTQLYSLLSDWLALKGTFLVEELCKPIAKVRSEFRDIIFQSKEDCPPVIEKDNDTSIFIVNLGKHGFWNSIFENESAPNDIRVVFASKDGTFEVGTNKNGRLISEQNWKSGYWTKNEYGGFMGDRTSQKTGDAAEPIIWPGV